MNLMRKHKKLKGFTTVELGLVMLLAALISSLAYGSYTFLSKQFNGYTKSTTEMLEMRQCLNLLKKDIQECRRLYVNGQTLECAGEKQSIFYDLENEEYLVRTQLQRADTFRLSITGKTFTWMKQPVVPGKAIIDELVVITEFKGTNTEIKIKKQYSNQDLMVLHSIYGD